MSNKKKIIIILNNNLTALIMLSYYFQNKNKYKNIKIILIIDETYKKSEFRRYDNKIIVNILKIIDPKLMQYESIKISNGSNFKLKNALYFIKNFKNIRNENLKIIKKISEISRLNIMEIWTGNSEIINFFFIKKKILKFEHGLSELSKYLNEEKKKFNIFIIIKRRFEDLISQKIFFKKNLFFELKMASIFKSLTKKKIKNIIEIKKKNFLKAIRYFNSYYKIKFKKIKNNIIINYPFPDSSNKHLIKIFNNEFSLFVKNILKISKIDEKYTIILKRKSYQSKNNVLNLIKIMKNNDFKNKIIFFEDIYYENLIIDFFLEIIKPKIIITNLNSSVIVFKSLFPNKQFFITDFFVTKFFEKNKSYFSNFKNEKLNFIEYKKNIENFTQ
jgi:hypothetical protein